MVVSPLARTVNGIKLIEYIFLFNGIIKVAGYTASPTIQEISIQ